MESQKTQNSPMTIKKNNKSRGLTLPDFKIFRAMIIKTVWYWWNNAWIDQRKNIESSEIHQHRYSQLIFHKRTKVIQVRKSFQQIELEQLDLPQEKFKSRYWCYTFHKN